MHLITGTGWGCILLVHWNDWYQWNNFYSIGIPLVKNKIFCNSIKKELPNINAGKL